MILAALLEPDAAAQEAMYQDVQERIEEVVPALLPFSEVVDTAAYRSDVDGLVVSPWITRYETVTKER